MLRGAGIPSEKGRSEIPRELTDGPSRLVRVASPAVGAEEADAVREVLLSGRFVSGPKVEELERKFAHYHSVGHAVAVNSGTAALHVALAVLGVEQGDEVIVPPLTFFSTVSSVLHQCAVPIFADIDPATYCLDPADVERRITPRTKAIIAVHLFGNAADMDGLTRVARERGLHLVEDCAQAHGSEYRGRKVGSIGDLGTFSFFATKHMTTGEGGMILTDRADWAEHARRIRNHGMEGRDRHVCLGYNYRMNEIAAAIGLVQLGKLDRLNRRRIEHSRELIARLAKLEIDWLTLPTLDEQVLHTFFWCPILIDEERLGGTTSELVRRLRDEGVETRNRYWEPLYRQPVLLEKHLQAHRVHFREHDVDYGSLYLENAEQICGRLIGLPNHPGLTREDLDHVVETIARLARGGLE